MTTNRKGDDVNSAAAGFESRLASVRSRVAETAARAGRDAAGITLVAVSKTHPPEAVAAALGAGQLLFGENRVQEAKGK